MTAYHNAALLMSLCLVGMDDEPETEAQQFLEEDLEQIN
jgi:hypothetical protein